MKPKMILNLMAIMLSLLLCGCTKGEEAVEADYWKGKLKYPTSEDSIMEQAKVAAQDLIEEGKDAVTSLDEMAGYWKENRFFAELGQSIGDLFKQWGMDGQDGATLPASSSSGAEVSLYDTTILEDASKIENGRVAVGFDRVVDGDTIIVSYKEWLLRVRLIGINAPESVHKDEEKNTEDGVAASKFLKEFLNNTSSLWLEFDQDPEDDYGRTLAYVWLSEKGTMIEEELLNGVILKNGYAEIMTIEPNQKYAQDLEKIIK